MVYRCSRMGFFILQNLILVRNIRIFFSFYIFRWSRFILINLCNNYAPKWPSVISKFIFHFQYYLSPCFTCGQKQRSVGSHTSDEKWCDKFPHNQELPTYSTSFHSHKNINPISIEVVTRTQGGRAGIPASCLVFFILRMEIPRGEELCLAVTLLACSPICLCKPRQTLSAGYMEEHTGRKEEEEPMVLPMHQWSNRSLWSTVCVYSGGRTQGHR